MRWIAQLSLLLACSSPAWPQTSAKDLYFGGVQALQKGDLTTAKTQFSQAAKAEPDNKLILYNWGLSEFQAGNAPMAVALWRRTLFLDPDFNLARQALSFAEKNVKLGGWKGLNSEASWLRENILIRVSLDKLLLTFALLLTGTGFLILRYAGQRRLALLEERALPPTPYVAGLLSLISLLALALTFFKGLDDLQARATVVSPTLKVHSAPNTDAPELFSLNGGTEVLLKQQVKDWTQISYPGGIVGWVESNGVFQTSGHKIW